MVPCLVFYSTTRTAVVIMSSRSLRPNRERNEWLIWSVLHLFLVATHTKNWPLFVAPGRKNGGVYWENTTWTGGEVSPERGQGINIDLGIIGIIYEVTYKGLAAVRLWMHVCVCVPFYKAHLLFQKSCHFYGLFRLRLWCMYTCVYVCMNLYKRPLQRLNEGWTLLQWVFAARLQQACWGCSHVYY